MNAPFSHERFEDKLSYQNVIIFCPIMLNTKRDQNKTLSVILTGLAIISLGIFLYHYREVFTSLREFRPQHVLALAFVHIIFLLVIGMLNKLVIQRLDPKISTAEIIHLQFINNFLNKIFPKGGPTFRAMYLKKQYNFPYTYFISALAGLVVLEMAGQSLVVLVGMYLIYLQIGLYNTPIILSFTILLMGAFFLMVIRPVISDRQNKILKVVKRVVEGWNLVLKYPKDILKFIFISVLALIIKAIGMIIVFDGIGSPIGILEALLLASLSSILSYVNFTPDGLGVREGIYIFTTSIILIPEPTIVLGSLVERAITFLASAMYAGTSYFILKRMEKMNYEYPTR